MRLHCAQWHGPGVWWWSGLRRATYPRSRPNYLLVKNIAAMGLQWTDYRSREPEAVAAAQAAMFGLWSQDKLNPIVSRTLPLARYEEGLSALGSGGACGKSNFIPPATWEY